MASTNLNRTPSSASNRKTWTWSGWVKKSTLGSQQVLFQGGDGGYPEKIVFTASDILEYDYDIAGTDYTVFVTDRKFRDVNGWLHIVVAKDTTQATETDRIKIYVNGEQQSLSEYQLGYPPQNHDGAINNNVEHCLGSNSNGGEFFGGIMSHVHFVDGSALAPTVFGSTDSTTGEWKINTSPSVTYGTNGFFMFKDDNSLNDDSGNSNNFALEAGTLTKTEDCPSNVFATFNPLARNASNTYANGNTTYDYSNNFQKSTVTTLTTNNKKIYAEFKVLRNTTMHLGIAGDTYISDGRTVTDTSASHTYDIRGHTGAIVLQTGVGGDANIYADGSDTSINVDFTTATNDIIMIAFDPTTKKIWWGKNGTWSSSGNPATGANASYTYSGTATSDFCFGVGSEGSNAGAISANFGNGYFGTTAVSSAGANASGIGIFEYDVPTGYTALSTKGLNL